MLSMHSILVSVAAGGPLTFDSQLKKRGSIPCCSSLLLACVQTSPPIRKKLETGLLLPFFPEGSRGKGGGRVGVYTGFPSFFKYTLVPCFPLLFCYVFRLSEEDEP